MARLPSGRLGDGMALISYSRHQFPPVVIQHAVWLYLRFTHSYRDVEELLAERGLDISYETIRRWVLKFGTVFARGLRARRPRPSSRWHLDEMVAVIGGARIYLWRAVDDEGEVLDILVQKRRNKAAAVKLIPSLVDHNRCAHSRRPMDMIIQGWSTKRFQAWQQWSRMSSYEVKTRLESQLSRMNCQTFSTGLSSGDLGGSGSSVMLAGTSRAAEPCHPAWSRSSTA